MRETWVWSVGLGRSPAEGKGYPLQYSGLENSMDCVVHEVAESDTTEWLSRIIWESILCWYIVLGIENRAALISNVNATCVCVCVCVCLEAAIVRDIFTNKRQWCSVASSGINSFWPAKDPLVRPQYLANDAVSCCIFADKYTELSSPLLRWSREMHCWSKNPTDSSFPAKSDLSQSRSHVLQS